MQNQQSPSIIFTSLDCFYHLYKQTNFFTAEMHYCLISHKWFYCFHYFNMCHSLKARVQCRSPVTVQCSNCAHNKYSTGHASVLTYRSCVIIVDKWSVLNNVRELRVCNTHHQKKAPYTPSTTTQHFLLHGHQNTAFFVAWPPKNQTSHLTD